MMKIFWLIVVMLASVTSHHRGKRYVAFRKGSTFFNRLNYKINAVAWTTIFAHASGFKVAWHLPDGSRAPRDINDLHESTQLLYEGHGFDGRACLVRTICEAMNYVNKTGVMTKILKLLSRNANETHDGWFDCKHGMSCPLQLININFTQL